MKTIINGVAVILLTLAVIVPAFAQQISSPAQTTAQAGCPPQATKVESKAIGPVIPFTPVPNTRNGVGQ